MQDVRLVEAALVLFLAAPMAAAADQQAQISACINEANVDACADAAPLVNCPPLSGPVPTAAEMQCLNRQILTQQAIAAMKRAAQVCGKGTQAECALASQRSVDAGDAAAKAFNIPYTRKNQVSGAGPNANAVASLLAPHSFDSCSGQVATPLEVSQRIVGQIATRLQLSVSPQEQQQMASLLDADAVTTRDVIRHLVDVHQTEIRPGRPTREAVEFLLNALLYYGSAGAPSTEVDSYALIAQNSGGLKAVVDQITGSDAYLNRYGDFVVPGPSGYLPCRIAETSHILYVSRACDDSRGNAVDTAKWEVHVPRGYGLAWKSWITTQNNSPTETICQTSPRRAYFTVQAHHPPHCTDFLTIHSGTGEWMGVEVQWQGVGTAYPFKEAADTCPDREHVASPSWASSPPVTCGPALPAPATCTFTATRNVQIRAFDRNRCGERGAAIGPELTLRAGDTRTVTAPTTWLLWSERPNAQSKWSSDKLEFCGSSPQLQVP
jgi:hypothetical protein